LLLALPLSSASAEDYPQWGGSPSRNNVSNERNLPADWAPGEFERKSGRWLSATAKNIKWVATLGSQTYGTPVIADGRVFIGTNNSNGYLKYYPNDVDLGCILCFNEQNGEFLWQFSAEKLPTGRVHDWPLQGIVSSPLVEGDRAWFVSNRGEVICVDTHGFYDGEDDGPVTGEYVPIATFRPTDNPVKALLGLMSATLDRGELPPELRTAIQEAGDELPAATVVKIEDPGSRWSFSAETNAGQRHYLIRRDNNIRVLRRQTPGDKQEADVVWRFDMMQRLGSSQHNMATCCITSWKDALFVTTSNGVDEAHLTVPAPNAPSFFAMNKQSGEVLWTSNLPGANIHHGQWSAPAVGILGGVPQVIFCGGDGYVYSFHAEKWRDGQPQLLWKFDTNAKDTVLELGGRGTRNDPIAIPVLYDNKVFVSTGQDPEHGEGVGCIWCIDATRRLDGSDVSPHKVVDSKGQVIPHRRITNLRTWQETRLWGGDVERTLDKGVLDDYLHRTLANYGVPSDEMTVTPIVPGAEWKMISSAVPSETLYVWKRPLINTFGKREYHYILATPRGERLIDNPDSAAVWKYESFDHNSDGKLEFYEQMHRSISSPAIANGLLFCPDFSGLLHCLDIKTGRPHWTCDMLAACWSTPLIADGRLFVGDEDGDINIFRPSPDPKQAGIAAKPDDKGKINPLDLQPLSEINMGNSVYCTPIAANGVLFVTSKDHLFAIQRPEK
jgi:outer membrane protein assembly factor BamB